MDKGHVPTRPIELTARQLVWLKELGIAKPWLPVSITDTQAHSTQTTDQRSTAERLSVRQSAASPLDQRLSAERSPVLQSAERLLDQRSSAEPSPGQDTFAGVVHDSSSQVPPPPGLSMGEADLRSLEDQIRQCESCGLCRERTHAVPGQGVMHPSIMVVGEAPGEQEDRHGLPFVGRSGQLLDNMLAAIAHRRDTNVYITNVVKCRPPGNRNPDAQEIASCSTYLTKQIEIVQPQAILAMGRFAAQTLLKKDAAMQALRGKVHFVDLGQRQIPVVATYHPAYLLRRPVEKASAWQDLKRIEALVAK